MSIRSAMVRYMLLFIVLPFILFGFFSTSLYSHGIESVITQSLEVVANARIKEMTDFCGRQEQNLSEIASMDITRASILGDLDPSSSHYIQNMLLSRSNSRDYLKSISIVSANRFVVASSSNFKGSVDSSIDFLIHDLGDRDFFISNIVLSEDRSYQLLAALYRVKERGETIGYVLAEINPDFYTAIREQSSLWDSSTFYLLDGKSQIITAGTPSEGRGSFVTSPNEREDYQKAYAAIDFEKEPHGHFRYKMGHDEYITYYSNVTYTDWQVLLTVNLSQYQLEERSYRMLFISLIVLLMVVMLWIGFFTSKRIVVPINSISEVLKRIQKDQNYTLRIPLNRHDELGELSLEINDMLQFIETENLYQQKQQRLLEEKASQDALTKVLNKERFHEYLEETLTRHRKDSSSFALLFIDVDDFKAFNTLYGHHIGDQVLLFLSDVLSTATKGIVGRAGGDEFVTIVEEPAVLSALDSHLQDVHKQLANEFYTKGSNIHLSICCSIGVVFVDYSMTATPFTTADELLRQADAAMYEVKNKEKHGHYIVTLTPQKS